MRGAAAEDPSTQGLQEACGAALKAVEEQKQQRARDRAEREAAVENRRRIERETRDALRADKRGGGGGGGVRGGDGGQQGVNKNDKDKTFRAKEKRKREWGQQSGGGKNWVEEEKRLLRHSGAGGFGFD